MVEPKSNTDKEEGTGMDETTGAVEHERHSLPGKPAQPYVLMRHSKREKVRRHAKRKARPLRGHPRWAPTNEQSDMSCAILLFPSGKTSRAKHRYRWMYDSDQMDDVEQDMAWKKERYFNGAFRHCMKVKYATSYTVAKTVLMEKFGPDEEIAD